MGWGEGDIRYWVTGYDIPARDKGWLVMDRLNSRGVVGVNRVIALNNRRDKFKDPRVRKALTLAVDFEWENRVLHFGQLERARALLAQAGNSRDGAYANVRRYSRIDIFAPVAMSP